VWLFFRIVKISHGVRIKIWGIPFYWMYLYFLFVFFYSLPGFMHYGIEGFMHYKQFFVFIFLLNAFYYYPKIVGYAYNSLLRTFFFMGTLFSIVNLLLFLTHPGFIQITFIDRFSAGYPTVDVVPLAYCFMVCLLYKDLGINSLLRLLCSLLLLLSLLSQFTGSGTVFTILVLLTTAYYWFKKKDDRDSLVANFKRLLFAMGLFIAVGISYVLNAFPEIAERSFPILENRLLSLMGREDESTLNINTMEVRNDQFNKSLKYYPDDLIIGTGYGPVSIKEDKRDKDEYVFIENQFKHNIIVIGYLGSFLFLLFIISNFYTSCKSTDELDYKLVYILSSALYILACNNICTLDILQSFIPFCMFYAIKTNREAIFFKNHGIC